jgi:MoaA/NifB/PqqE/SkfB family radical SAM enzyme
MYLSPLQKQLALLRMLRVPDLRALPLRALWGNVGLLRSEKFVRHGNQVVIHSFLPPFPSAAFSRMARSLQALRRGDARPMSAYVAVTGRCGYRCWHCSYAHRGGDDMSRQTLLKTIAGLQELGISIIGFTGGEPLKREDLEDLVAAVGERSTAILFTSGDGLTAERCRALKDRGLFAAAVSLDHYEPQGHDARRGRKGAFDAALRAIRLCREAGLYTMMQLVATKDMLRDEALRKYLDLAGQLRVHEIRLLEPMPAGYLLSGDPGAFLTETDRAALRNLHLRTNRSRTLPKVCSFAHIEHADCYGCGAGLQHLYVDARGNVCPCDFTPISFGNVAEEDIGAIWQRLRTGFSRPRATCFLMQHADELRERFAGSLPLSYTAVQDICARPARDGEVPRFYRTLGLRPHAGREGARISAIYEHAQQQAARLLRLA